MRGSAEDEAEEEAEDEAAQIAQLCATAARLDESFKRHIVDSLKSSAKKHPALRSRRRGLCGAELDVDLQHARRGGTEAGKAGGEGEGAGADQGSPACAQAQTAPSTSPASWWDGLEDASSPLPLHSTHAQARRTPRLLAHFVSAVNVGFFRCTRISIVIAVSVIAVSVVLSSTVPPSRPATAGREEGSCVLHIYTAEHRFGCA